MKKLFTKLLLLLILPILPFTGVTNANLTDLEVAQNNYFQASSLDVRLQNSEGEEHDGVFFDESKFETENTLSETVVLKNRGSLDLEYWPKFVYLNGSQDACNNLSLTALVDGTEVYDGTLSDFDLETEERQLVQGGINEWEFTLSNDNDDESLQGEDCAFDIKFIAFVDAEEQTGFSDTETLSNSITLAYEPTLSVSLNILTHQLILTFGNLQNFQTLDYELNYDTDTISDHVENTITLTGENDKTIAIDLGTVSGGILFPHINPHNFNLTIDLTDIDGHHIFLVESL